VPGDGYFCLPLSEQRGRYRVGANGLGYAGHGLHVLRPDDGAREVGRSELFPGTPRPPATVPHRESVGEGVRLEHGRVDRPAQAHRVGLFGLLREAVLVVQAGLRRVAERAPVHAVQTLVLAAAHADRRGRGCHHSSSNAGMVSP